MDESFKFDGITYKEDHFNSCGDYCPASDWFELALSLSLENDALVARLEAASEVDSIETEEYSDLLDYQTLEGEQI